MNWDKIEQLLNVYDKVRQHPQLKAIAAEALAELAKHNVHTPMLPPTAKPPAPEPEIVRRREVPEEVTNG